LEKLQRLTADAQPSQKDARIKMIRNKMYSIDLSYSINDKEAQPLSLKR